MCASPEWGNHLVSFPWQVLTHHFEVLSEAAVHIHIKHTVPCFRCSMLVYQGFLGGLYNPIILQCDIHTLWMLFVLLRTSCSIRSCASVQGADAYCTVWKVHQFVENVWADDPDLWRQHVIRGSVLYVIWGSFGMHCRFEPWYAHPGLSSTGTLYGRCCVSLQANGICALISLSHYSMEVEGFFTL